MLAAVQAAVPPERSYSPAEWNQKVCPNRTPSATPCWLSVRHRLSLRQQFWCYRRKCVPDWLLVSGRLSALDVLICVQSTCSRTKLTSASIHLHGRVYLQAAVPRPTDVSVETSRNTITNWRYRCFIRLQPIIKTDTVLAQRTCGPLARSCALQLSIIIIIIMGERGLISKHVHCQLVRCNCYNFSSLYV